MTTTATPTDEARTLLATVTNATHPGDIFGPRTDDPKQVRAARRTYRRAAALLHPDQAHNHGIDAAQAETAFTTLTAYYTAWTEATPGTRRATPDPTTTTITTARDSYTLGHLIARGTITNVYAAHAGSTGKTVTVKIPRDPTNNARMDSERDALTRLATLTTTTDWAWARPYFPRLLDQATHRTPDGKTRHLNVLDDLTPANGFHPLTAVLAAYPTGLDGRDYAWMHRRLLRAVATAHHAGLIHGAILPGNVLIHPAHHGVVLTGWTLTGTPGKPLPGRDRNNLDAYPPEATTAATTKTDVYMTHALMTRMLDPLRNRAQLRFATGCMQTNPARRPDAAQLLAEYDELLDRAYGPRTFRPFTIPTPTQ